MTGAEHYRRAEELVAEIERDDDSVDFGDGGEAYVAAATVHALLALAAVHLFPTPGQVAAAMPVTNVNRGGGFGVQAGRIDGGVRF